MNNTDSKTSFISSMEYLSQNISNNNLKIGVIGIGRIGLPTALSFADKGFSTVGIDINTKLVEKIISGDYPLKDEPEFDKIFDQVTKNGKFSATSDVSASLPTCDVIILSLPTPMDTNYVPNYSALLSVGKNLHDFIKSGSLVIVESTVEPGFIENELISIIEGDDKKHSRNVDFSIVACPETANPGEILSDFKKLPRLIGGIDDFASKITSQLYKHVFGVDTLVLPNCKTANAAKLTANVFRDVNIAFVNELALLFEKMDIDILQVLDACDRKYNFQTHYPGAGVGGPCLPVNSYQYLNTARKTFDGMLRLIEVAREINEHMPRHTVELTIDALNQMGKSVKNSTIGILGISYKPNVADIQLSPSKEIIEILENLGAHVRVYDPFYKSQKIFSYKVCENIYDAVDDADAIILVTAHTEFENLELQSLKQKMKTPIFIDTRGIIDMNYAKNNGIIFRGIGRGFSNK